MFKNVVIGLLIATTAYFAWISLTITADPISRTFDRYNHMKIYEDGSFVGEDRTGTKVDGCIDNAPCQD